VGVPGLFAIFYNSLLDLVKSEEYTASIAENLLEVGHDLGVEIDAWLTESSSCQN